MSAHSSNCNHHGSGKVLRWSLFATVAFVLIQFGAGLQSGSLALLSDAGHNLTDALALGLAMFGVYLQNKPADSQRTFGYHRGGVLAAFVNALALLVLSVYLFIEAYHRLRAPQSVQEGTMIYVAAVGIVLNVAILLGLKKHDRDVNIRAASMHMLGDAVGSVAIIAGAIVIHYTGWMAIDPILSIAIGCLIIWSGVDITRESLNILLEGTPRGVELSSVQRAMRGVPGVLDVHDVHVWSLGSSAHALSCHALIDDMPPSESECILAGVNHVLAGQFGIHHTTIQFEHQRCPVSMKGCSMAETSHRH